MSPKMRKIEGKLLFFGGEGCTTPLDRDHGDDDHPKESGPFVDRLSRSRSKCPRVRSTPTPILRHGESYFSRGLSGFLFFHLGVLAIWGLL